MRHVVVSHPAIQFQPGRNAGIQDCFSFGIAIGLFVDSLLLVPKLMNCVLNAGFHEWLGL